MKKEDCKPGVWVDGKQDMEFTGKILTKPDKNGYVDIQGPDEERSDGIINEHYSRLTIIKDV